MIMTGKERIFAAFDHIEADRVPLYIHAINEAPIIGIGKHITDGLPELKPFTDMTGPEKIKLVDTLFLIHETFNIDGITTFEIGHQKILNENLVVDEWGVVYRLNPHGTPVPVQYPLKSIDDLKKFIPPVPAREHLLFLNMARDRFKGQKALFWLMRGTFVRSWRLIGMENLMILMFDNPEAVHQIAQMVTDYNLNQLDMLIDSGVEVVILNDDIADKFTTLISPDQFKEFVNPYNKQLVDFAHKKGIKIVLHSDGNLWNIMDTIIAAGYDGLNPLEPQADMGLKKVKDYCGDKICLLGNIDCVDLLTHGTPLEVENAVIQAIKDGAPGGGYILCDSNTLHPGVNPENCIAMFEAAVKHGGYTK
jgi:uroporphyrinogen decarboxylase